MEITIIIINHDNNTIILDDTSVLLIVYYRAYITIVHIVLCHRINIKSIIRLEFLYVEFSGFNFQLQSREIYPDNLLFVVIFYENFKFVQFNKLI